MAKIIKIGFLGLAVMCLLLDPVSVFAKEHKGPSSRGAAQGWKDAGSPPGWSRGQKTGWDGGSMPPGLARKSGRENPSEENEVKKPEEQEKETEKSDKD